MNLISKIWFLLILGIVAISWPAYAQETNQLTWKEISPGYHIAHYYLKKPDTVISPEIILLKFSPNHFLFYAVSAQELTGSSTDLVTLTRRANGVAGINANFFDLFGKTLGLLISQGKTLSKIHNGGKVLTGLFIVENNSPKIVHRSALLNLKPTEAIQAGPRLIENRKPVELSSHDQLTRRSGIAITGSGEVIIFATVLRFPGVSLHDIQEMLIDKKFDIIDALNLDGGGSSQLCIEKFGEQTENIFITGGDKVPAGLVVVNKEVINNAKNQGSSFN